MKIYKIIENGIEYVVEEYDNETKFWYLNNLSHRENGPAIECSNGFKAWYKYGKYHREDGPARILANNINIKQYYLNNIHYPDISSDEEWIIFQIIT